MFKMEVYLKSICFILLTAKVICNIVYEGDPAVLVCTIASDAYPSWNGPPHISGRSTLYNYEASQHFNPALIDNKLLRMKWAENKRDLNFTSVLQEDEGNYSCSAASIGTMSITVTVEGVPETPTISISPTKDAYIEGNTLTFMCAIQDFLIHNEGNT
ncbi:hypothetical protein MAR_021939 [Mya arenaria]|uniref:Immunoglobulin domain-containing protein n=1 Tax=Mya arenaria TaxID=6604 RepID=A0ABY7E9P2_MYAAR|nr:hypothetical protein MAR_021939 [Mya arenaria]